jgi:Tol biopolymer transport system component
MAAVGNAHGRAFAHERPLSPALPVSLAQLVALAALGLGGLSSCTLLDTSFDPPLVSSSDAGGLPLVETEVDPGLPGTLTPLGCSTEGTDGIVLNGADPSCSSSIGLSDPGALELAADAGAVAEDAPSLSLAPCEEGFTAFGAPERITGLAFDENVFGPALSSDGRTLYFSAYDSDEQQIYTATRSARGTEFTDVTPLAGINAGGMDGSPFVSPSGERIYFFSERQGGAGNRDVWSSARDADGLVFLEPEPLSGVNSEQADLLPWLSADELTMYFVSGRPGGRGASDLWRATRTSSEAEFEPPANAADLSSGQNEGRVVLSADGLSAFFSSDRGGGRGGPDIWTATRANTSQPFSSVRNLFPLNSAANDQDVSLSSDDTELFFASSRTGVSELWRVARSCSD